MVMLVFVVSPFVVGLQQGCGLSLDISVSSRSRAFMSRAHPWLAVVVEMFVTQGVGELPDFIQFKPHAAVPLDSVFSAVGSDALDLLGRTLALNPLQRCTATEVCTH